MTKEKVDYELYATVNRFTVLIIVLASLLFAGLAVIFSTQLFNRHIGYKNQAYSIAKLCIISTTPTQRTSEYVTFCYEKAEEMTGVSIERFGDAK